MVAFFLATFFLATFFLATFFLAFFLVAFFLVAFFLVAFFLVAFFLATFFLAFFLVAFFLVAFFFATFFLATFFLATFFLAAFFLVAFFLVAFFLVAFFLVAFFFATFFLATFFLATFFFAVFFFAAFLAGLEVLAAGLPTPDPAFFSGSFVSAATISIPSVNKSVYTQPLFIGPQPYSKSLLTPNKRDQRKKVSPCFLRLSGRICVVFYRLSSQVKYIGLVLVVLLMVSCCEQEATDERGWPNELVLGLVPALEAEALVDNLEPLANHLEQELGIPVRSFVPQDYTGLVEALGAGRADIGMLPPFAAMLGQRRYDIEPILISSRKGEVGYRAQWFTNDPALCDGPVEYNEYNCDAREVGRENRTIRFASCPGSIESIRNQTVAFVDPSSTSGFLFPVVQLENNGIDHQTDINSLFVGGHDAAVLAVYANDAKVGVSYDDARNMVCRQYPDIGEKVIVFEHTQMMPNDGVQLRPGLPDDLVEAIKAAFLSLAEEQKDLPDDEKVLWILYEIDGFVPMTEGLYDPVRDAYELMRD